MSSKAIEATELFYPSTEELEPQETPTDELEDETPSEDGDSEAETEEDTEEAEEEAEEPEESEEEEGEDSESEDSTVVEAERLMHADYTQKIQALAEDKRLLEAEKTAFDAEKSKLSDLSAQLEVLVSEDNDIDWEELKEYEPEKYIELKDKADARKAKLEEVKANQPTSSAAVLTKDELTAESNDLFASEGWTVDGKLVEDKYKSDMDMMLSYMSESGYSDDEFKNIQHSHHFKTLLDAARFNMQKSKSSALKKKVKNAPKATKPAAAKKSIKKSAEDVFYS